MTHAERHERRPRSLRSTSGITRMHNILPRASRLSCVINLLNTIIGSGLLASPHALAQMGIMVGTWVILWSGITAALGLYFQYRCARYLDRGTSSFFALSSITYPNAAVLFDAAISIKCFGVGVSYLIIIGDLMPGVIDGIYTGSEPSPFLVDRQFWITAFMLLVIPLAFLRRLDSLKYTSVIALFSIGYLVILVFYRFAKDGIATTGGDIRIIKWLGFLPTLRSFPVMVFAYTCHQNMFSILNEIRDNSHKSITSMIGCSIGPAAIIYTLVAITGYLCFGDRVSGNIVGMYSPSIGSTIGKAAIVILATFSFPLQVHPCRASVEAVLKWRPIKNQRSLVSPNGSPARSVPLLSGRTRLISRGETMSDIRFASITTAIIILSYIVAMTVSSLDRVLAYVGSTGSTSISFILPGLFYYKISSPDSVHHQRLLKEENDDLSESDRESLLGGTLEKGSGWHGVLRKLSLALVIYGLIVMAVCLGVNLFAGAAH